MKYIVLSLFSFTILWSQAFAQSNLRNSKDWCGTDHPEQITKEVLDANQPIQDYLANRDVNSQRKTTTIIPVVVHIVHDNGNGRISREQVHDAIRILNEDFNRVNSDTNETRQQFKSITGAMDIEFRLAKKDPNGNCIDGILYYNSEIISDRSGFLDPIKSINPAYATNKYFNIWVTHTISSPGSGIQPAAYAYLPSFSSDQLGLPWSEYGVVTLHEYFGSIGTGFTDGRTISHEVGHCFDLWHTFQSGCGSTCHNTGDLVCDTPPVANSTQACNSNQNLCANDAMGGTPTNPNPYSSNVEDQIENYMSYDNCQNMFSQGQVDRMEGAMATRPTITSLTQNQTHIDAGVDDAYYFTAPECAPTADFLYSKDLLCATQKVSFSDISYNATKDSTWQYNWTFPGGTPATSSLENPVIDYNTPGVYGVTLTVTNSNGSSPAETKTGIIEVKEELGVLGPGMEDFFNPSWPNNIANPDESWIVDNEPASSTKWERNSVASWSFPASAYLNQYTVPAGAVNNMTTPGYDLSGFNGTVKLKFKIAYARSARSGSDLLKINTSTNCGESWVLAKFYSGIAAIGTPVGMITNGGALVPNFVPSGSDWGDLEVDLSNFVGSKNLRIQFSSESANVNNIWLDDIEIVATNTGLSVYPKLIQGLYPNPTSGQLNLNLLASIEGEAEVLIIDQIGRQFTIDKPNLALGSQTLNYDLNEFNLESGLYFLQVKSEQGITRQKFILE